MKDQKGKQKGFTLVELVIVLAVLAVLAAIVVPSVTGFLGRGKERAYEADKRILQEAVDAWRSDFEHRTGDPWPLLGTGATPGTPTADNNSYIDIGALAADNYVASADVVKSADTEYNTTATNTPSGSYGWYVDTGGVVKSVPDWTKDTYP